MKKTNVIKTLATLSLSILALMTGASAYASDLSTVKAIRFNRDVKFSTTHIQGGQLFHIRPNSVFHRMRGEANGFLGLNGKKSQCALVIQNSDKLVGPATSKQPSFEKDMSYSVTPMMLGNGTVILKFTAIYTSTLDSENALVCSSDGELISKKPVTIDDVKDALGGVATLID